VWDLVGERIAPYLRDGNQLPLLLGCDCSIVVGTAHAMSALGEVHVIYIDGDFDDAPPDANITRSGAATAVWLLTHSSPFSPHSLPPENVTVIGWSKGPFDGSTKAGSVSLKEVQRMGPRQAIDDVLRRIPRAASVLVHLDIDVVRESELPAAYFPHSDGLSLQDTGEIIDAVLSDKRVRLIEVSEYAALRDPGGACALKITDLFAHGLAQRP
jgi:arginase